MKILHFSSFGSVCGVADYTEDMVAALAPHAEFAQEKFSFPRDEVEFKYTERKLRKLLERCVETSSGYDLVHVQHEFGFFVGRYPFHRSIQVFGDFLRQLRAPQVLITFHTGPFFPQKVTWWNYFEQFSINTRVWQRSISVLLQPGTRYRALVHNHFARSLLIKAGAHPSVITVMPHPMKTLPEAVPDEAWANKIKETLQVQPGSVVLSTLGFIIPGKGISSCLQVMKHLPENYKLVIGGGKPIPLSDSYLKEIQRFIKDEGLEQRVFITGYLNAAQIRTLFGLADMFLFLYVPVAYSSGAITMALQSHKPIVATNVKAFYDIQQEAQCLQLVFDKPAEEIARRIEALQADPAQKAQMLQRQEKYCKENTWCAAGDFIAGLYRAQLDQPAQAAQK